MKIEDLEQIIKILKQNDVHEFDFDNDGVRIRLTRGAPIQAASVVSSGGYNVDIQPVVQTVIPNNTVAATPQSAKSENINSNLFKVESPIVGTFYRKPSPDAQPFITEGATVTKGQTLCIIEAMKLMNEIEAPISGKIEKILMGDGQVVEFGEVLVLINPSA
jgi:acetyl-CoA carboxylase biotin carboxyl carrier protein